ncbi:unnamed protein product [Adineta ricciae]|uniref:AlgX/AlgJ SGNH hydrolase-like domain-containing protein n=1 Tax=Adineta ricciae TaxID=249248 RepID=A0A816C8K9_ADIRI|nr:unnamed protein product [Adineta ricciae]CAF1618212.1 unnamed protein product [Adineta ricciae]
MVLSIIMNYFTALGIFYLRTSADERKVRWLLVASVSGNLILLGFFKYTSFLVELLNILTLQRAATKLYTPTIHLPLGISFFTFHGLSYIIDVYRNEVYVEWNPITLGLYFSFFPQLIAGPIVRYHDVAQQLVEHRKFSYKEFAQGAVEFTIGLCKKMIIANTVGAVADTIFDLSIEKLDTSHAWIGLLTYSLQIYCDFSGYSDMAIGLARMFGIQFPLNFNYPYVSRSVREFWRRWHISLSSWFRDYLYISLGGNRVSELRVCSNLLTVFFLCGLWHGASWNFIIWGLFHGLFLALERTKICTWALSRTPRVLQHFYALSVISIGWVFFRASTLSHSIQFIKVLFGLESRHNRINVPVKQYLDAKVITVIIFAILGSCSVLSASIRTLNLLIISEIPSTEKRTLAHQPILNIWQMNDYIKKFDLFYNDHFGFRIRLVAMYAILNVKIFGISGVFHVIIGRNNWLFVTDYYPTDPRTLSGWQGFYPYSFDQLMIIQQNLEAENMWFIKRNITFLILPAPDKNSIYPEYLPWRFHTVVGPSRQAQIFEHIKLHSNISMIDVRQALITAKKAHKFDLYFRSDSHWNSIGSFFVYEEIMKRLLPVNPQFVPHRLEDFFLDRALKRRGDLADMANLKVSHVLEHQFVPKQNVTEYNNKGAKKGKILFLGDSFTESAVKEYFRRHFEDVRHVRVEKSAYSKLDKKIVLQYHPDVVIYESVERLWISDATRNL